MLNIACIMGRFTADPELRHTPNDIAVVRFTLAVNRPKRAGAEEQADFINVTAWRQTAEFVSRYFRKGQLVAVDGSIRTGSYTDKDGNNRRTFEIVANNVHFAELKRDSYSNDGGYNAPTPQQDTVPATSATSFSIENTDGFEEMPEDDDLPF